MDLMVFGNGLPFGPLAGLNSYDKTAEFMRKAWVNFASKGNPGSQDFTWPDYETNNRLTVSINEAPSVLQDPYGIQREVLGGVLSNSWQEMGL